MNVKEGLQAALALIETNGWWNGLPRECAMHNASLNTMCVVTATYWTEVADGQELDLQAPLWLALPEGAHTLSGRTKDLIDFNDAHTEDDVKALFARAIAAEESKSCTT